MSSVDMSTKIGGRIVKPALPVVDASPPKTDEISFNETLQNYMKENVPLESKDGIQTRERVLNQLGVISRDWIRSVCQKQSLPADVVDSAGGQLFTSGSYRLGVHEPGADIDTILVAPNMCTRHDFFGEVLEERDDGTKVRDPDSLAERIRRHPDVTNFVPVEGAAVPILTFDFEGINIDLLFAKINSASVSNVDIDNDTVLDGVDNASEKSLNGPRVTNLIAALVSGTPERYQTFLTVVRCVRKWAKARGLYSNKFGYWGGVNINMGVALCVQLYPRASPATLLRKFFLVFKSWRWPNPVMLTKPHDAGYGLPVWNANNVHNARQVAPMITPAYPAMNSTLSISRQTLQIMHEEFCRGHQITERLWKQHQADPNAELHWDELFEKSDFFISYPYYISLCIVGPTEMEAQAWAGYVESRLRKLVSDMLGRSLPLSKIQLWPKKFPVCVADKTALLTAAQRRNSITYFVGFNVDTLRMRGRQLNIELQMHNFRDWELSKFQPLAQGMDLMVKSFKVKELPLVVFEDIYDGGKKAAMKKRRKIRDADPKVQEKKRLAKLQALKARMAEMQRKRKEKEEEDSKQQEEEENGSKNVKFEDEGSEPSDRKRKRDGGDGDEELEMKILKIESAVEETADEPKTKQEEAEEEEEDAHQLESALDEIQQDAGEQKTRAEAEADRRKLLAGELLVEAEEYDDDEEDLGYAGKDSYVGTLKPTALESAPPKVEHNDKFSLPLGEDEKQILREAGCNIVSDDEAVIIGGNTVVLPWRQSETTTTSKDENESKPHIRRKKPIENVKIVFKTKFDIVELDGNGHVIDKGDEDFMPSRSWIGRKGGFEFKLGERGLGYYRTGKKVVVPSNTYA